MATVLNSEKILSSEIDIDSKPPGDKELDSKPPGDKELDSKPPGDKELDLKPPCSLGRPEYPNLVVGAWKRHWDYLPTIQTAENTQR